MTERSVSLLLAPDRFQNILDRFYMRLIPMQRQHGSLKRVSAPLQQQRGSLERVSASLGRQCVSPERVSPPLQR